jgi:hypothetical protein
VIGPGDCAAGDVQGPRLLDLAGEFGANGLYMNLCNDPIANALDRIFAASNVGLAPPCLTEVRDTDATTPGLQEQCTVIQRTSYYDTGTTIEQKIPNCDDGPPPCWQHPQAEACAGGTGWAFNIDGAQNECVDGSIRIEVECLSCADANDPACAP